MNLRIPNIRLKPMYMPPINSSFRQMPNNFIGQNDERVGFLLPFITGAVVSAPLWFVAGNNKAQQNMMYQQAPYYNQPYPMYYPYQNTPTSYPSYYPYPPRS